MFPKHFHAKTVLEKGLCQRRTDWPLVINFNKDAERQRENTTAETDGGQVGACCSQGHRHMQLLLVLAFLLDLFFLPQFLVFDSY